MKRYAEEDAYDEELDDHGHLNHDGIEALIERDYACRLEGAPFPVDDAKLVPPAGACTACPKRSANQPTLFAEPDRKDVCTDVTCWRVKVGAFVDRERREVFGAGGRCSQEESRRIFNGGATLPWNSPWIELDAPCPDHPERLPWRQLLADLCPPATLAFTSQGRPVRLAKRSEVAEAIQQNGIDLAAMRGGARQGGDDDLEDQDEAGDASPGSRGPASPASDRPRRASRPMSRDRAASASSRRSSWQPRRRRSTTIASRRSSTRPSYTADFTTP